MGSWEGPALPNSSLHRALSHCDCAVAFQDPPHSTANRPACIPPSPGLWVLGHLTLAAVGSVFSCWLNTCALLTLFLWNVIAFQERLPQSSPHLQGQPQGPLACGVSALHRQHGGEFDCTCRSVAYCSMSSLFHVVICFLTGRKHGSLTLCITVKKVNAQPPYLIF